MPLCDECLHERLAWFKGVAQGRGERWAEAIARVVPLDRTWPPSTERMLAIARRKVADVATDARLVELLAGEVITGAARWWNNVLRRGLWRAG